MGARPLLAPEDDTSHSGLFRTDDRQRHDAASYAAHDAKNLIAVLEGNLQWLREEVPANGEVHEVIEDTMAVGRRLADLVLQALGGNEDSLTPILAPERLASIATESVRQLRTMAEGRGVALELDCTADPMALADRGLLLRVLHNLIDNAVDHSTKGGRVRVSCAQSRACASIAVSDQGCGIAEEALEAVFERGHSSRADSGQNFGLGLAFCRSVVRAHGGDIVVRSSVGNGATFIVELPLET